MPRGGRSHRLIRYTYILNGWWRAIMESFRSAWLDSLHHPASTTQSNLLASLSEKR
jgi:hypothetical protein